MWENEIKGSGVGWECCLDIIFISGVNQAWNYVSQQTPFAQAILQWHLQPTVS